MTTTRPEPILFHYPFSPWSRKITAYLAMRGIPYSECVQPFTMPRPDLAALGIKYRRIPILAIGRDIYCDTLVILEKLEELYPGSHLNAEWLQEHEYIGGEKEPWRGLAGGKALEKLLEKWTDVCVFQTAANSIPGDHPILEDEAFCKDREQLWGRKWSRETQDRLRPTALASLRGNFEFLEKALLEDGRRWALGGENPGLADIHAAWVFDWLVELGTLPENAFSAKQYPKTMAWRQRYRTAVENAKERARKPTKLDGAEAVKKILGSDFGESEGSVDDIDPLGLKKGQQVEVWPLDTTGGNKETGELVALTAQEVVVLTRSKEGDKDIRIHCPRWNFSVQVPRTDRGETNGVEGTGKEDHQHDLGAHGGDEGLGAEHYAERI